MNLETKKIIALPDPDQFHDFPEDLREQWETIHASEKQFFKFEKMLSNESFQIMEAFVDEVLDENFQQKLINTLSRPKPFCNFKFQIDNSGDYRQQWFNFRDKKMQEFVKKQVKNS